MYIQAREKYTDTVHCIMLKKKVGEDERLTTQSKVDFSKLPPYTDNLLPHIFPCKSLFGQL